MQRDDGTPAQVGDWFGDWWWVENGRVRFDKTPPKYHTIRPGVYVQFEIPNRLYGATINHEGDAV